MLKKFLLIAALVIAATLPLEAAEQVLVLDLETTVVRFTLDSTLHLVDGSMHLTEGTIVFDLESGQASGRVVFDAAQTETGNAKRDKKMHKKVLESGAFPIIVFQPSAIKGTLPEKGGGNLTLVGSVLIHGADHPVALVTRLVREGSEITATSALKVPFVEWGMHDPSVLIFRTDKVIEVTLEIHGTLTETTPSQ